MTEGGIKTLEFDDILETNERGSILFLVLKVLLLNVDLLIIVSDLGVVLKVLFTLCVIPLLLRDTRNVVEQKVRCKLQFFDTYMVFNYVWEGEPIARWNVKLDYRGLELSSDETHVEIAGNGEADFFVDEENIGRRDGELVASVHKKYLAGVDLYGEIKKHLV